MSTCGTGRGRVVGVGGMTTAAETSNGGGEAVRARGGRARAVRGAITCRRGRRGRGRGTTTEEEEEKKEEQKKKE